MAKVAKTLVLTLRVGVKMEDANVAGLLDSLGAAELVKSEIFNGTPLEWRGGTAKAQVRRPVLRAGGVPAAPGSSARAIGGEETPATPTPPPAEPAVPPPAKSAPGPVATRPAKKTTATAPVRRAAG